MRRLAIIAAALAAFALAFETVSRWLGDLLARAFG